MTSTDLFTSEALLQDIRLQTETHLAGGLGENSNAPGGNDMLKDILSDLSEVLQRLLARLEGDEGGSGGGGGGGGVSAQEPDVIAGTGRIWGDPHFIGQDGGKYDVQGEAGKTYNLLSDQDFQMNGRFDQYKNKDGLTVVGAVGISAGSDQVSVEKDGTVMVNGEELKAGETAELANGGSVSYAANGKSVSVDSGEWETDIEFRNKGNGSTAHLNIDVATENAIADGVKPHGLLGQTFDADDDARNGDKGKGTQGGGAIEGLDGEITDRGDRSTVQEYEVSGLYDRNFESFNQFFDDAESGSGQFDEELYEMMASTFSIMAQSMMMTRDMSSRG